MSVGFGYFHFQGARRARRCCTSSTAVAALDFLRRFKVRRKVKLEALEWRWLGCVPNAYRRPLRQPARGRSFEAVKASGSSATQAEPNWLGTHPASLSRWTARILEKRPHT